MYIPALSGEYHEILEHEETMELIKRAQNGDIKAQEILVNHNLGLVRSIVNRFAHRGHEREDLFQLGSIGLIKAIQKFDVNYGVKFSTYAVPMIVGEIKRFLRDDGIIKVSRNLKQVATKVKITKEKLFKKLGREASLQEIADELNIDKEEIIMALDSNAHPEYLYDIIHHDDGSPIHLIDKVINKEVVNDIDLIDKILLQEILTKLKPRERQIIVLRYFKDKTQTEIAKTLGISQVQVSRIEKKVLQIMRDLMQKT